MQPSRASLFPRDRQEIAALRVFNPTYVACGSSTTDADARLAFETCFVNAQRMPATAGKVLRMRAPPGNIH